MSKKQWMVLLMLFLTYLLLGASIFYHIESRLEIERQAIAKVEQIEINALLQEHYVPSRNHDHDEILDKLTRYCGKSVYNYTEGKADPPKWDFYNSFYFAYTVVSTIGYGNLAPTNMLGRILMIFYGLIGIPMNGILLAQLGEFFGHTFVKAHQKYKSYKRGRNDYSSKKLTPFETRKVGLAAQIFAYLTPGFVMFIFFPAFLFSHYEGWTYDEAVYYAFVTLTTIGFGDYVAGQDNRKGSGFFFVLYKIFLICWISFGLGYIVMIMTFIARGMRSKKITRIEHKLAINLKHTQSKIWNEFNKEIHYLRRVFNELQLSKVKRVYVNEFDYEIPTSKFPHSNSFPDLRELAYGTANVDATESILTQRPRRRANSEVVPTEDQIARVVSETDLQRIDKTATFAAHAMVQPAELLARLVNILGYIPPASEDTDEPTFQRAAEEVCGKTAEGNGNAEPTEKLSERTEPSWAIGSERIPRFLKPRSRATSEIRLHETKPEDRNVEWTWSGPTASRKIQELMKARVVDLKQSPRDRNKDAKDAKLSKYRTLALAKVPRPWKFSNSEKKTSEVDSKDVRQGWFEGRRDSSCSVSGRHYYTHTGAATQPPSSQEGSNLLEETSLADFLRALTLLHASVGTVDEQLTIGQSRPRRKMGTACLSPPKLPSLFTLFSSQPSGTSSNQTTITRQPNRLSLSVGRETASRRGSLAFVPTVYPIKPRRFSLRPVPTPTSPPTPPLSNARPQASENINRAPFVFESPKEPLIKMEGLPATSSPMKPFPNPRRFSLRPTQSQTQSGVPPPGGIPSKVPRWKAGMLQRQIGQMNLRRRVRAFSLSDVEADRNDRNVGSDSNPTIRNSVVEPKLGYVENPKSLDDRRISILKTREEAKTVRLACHTSPFQNGSSSAREVPLVEVKIEKPNLSADNRNNNPLDPTELKVEKSDSSNQRNA